METACPARGDRARIRLSRIGRLQVLYRRNPFSNRTSLQSLRPATVTRTGVRVLVSGFRERSPVRLRVRVPLRFRILPFSARGESVRDSFSGGGSVLAR